MKKKRLTLNEKTIASLSDMQQSYVMGGKTLKRLILLVL
ncbi:MULTISPECIES: class I lanthipeptide [Chitinophagaceae]